MNEAVFYINRMVQYNEEYPGKRANRSALKEDKFEIVLRRLSEGEFPLAYTVRDNDGLFTPKGSDKIYRAIIGEGGVPFTLFTKTNLSISYMPGILEKMCEDIENYLPVPRIIQSIQEFQENFVLYDGVLWLKTVEPCYKMEIRSDYICISITSISGLEKGKLTSKNYFRADEVSVMKRMIQEAVEFRRLPQKNTAFVDDWFKENYIRDEEVFCTEQMTYEMKLMEALKNEMQERLKKSIGECYCPDFDESPTLQMLLDKMLFRVWNDIEFKKHGYVLLPELYTRAFVEELSSIYGT